MIQSLKKIKINKLIRPLFKYLPFKLKAWIKRKKLRELISVDELKPQYLKSWKYLLKAIGKDSLGDYLEFGVCHGTSLNCMNQVIKELNLAEIRLFGFDSFEGLPKINKKVDADFWYKGQFKSDLKETRHFLTKNGIDWKKTFLIKGWFSDTLTNRCIRKFDIQKASVIMIDCDIYSSSKQALDFCKPLIKDKSILIFDDWNAANLAEKGMGEKRAFDEFLAENSHFTAVEFGNYKFENKPNGKLFIVANTRNSTFPEK